MENSHCMTHGAHREGGRGRKFKDYEACIFELTALSTCINTACRAALKRIVVHLCMLRTVSASLRWRIMSTE